MGVLQTQAETDHLEDKVVLEVYMNGNWAQRSCPALHLLLAQLLRPQAALCTRLGSLLSYHHPVGMRSLNTHCKMPQLSDKEGGLQEAERASLAACHHLVTLP